MKESKNTRSMNALNPFNRKLGILGGGQLARMLALEAFSLGLEVHVYSENENDPASQVTRFFHKGSASSAQGMAAFAKQMDFVTFESEFFDMSSLEDLSYPKIFPKPAVMRVLQDRSTQKKLLIENAVPTSPYRDVRSWEELQKVAADFHYQLVLKKTLGGYDGKGTFYIKSEQDLEALRSLFPAQFIAEKFIEFSQELAVTLVRSEDGSFVVLPLVQTRQAQSRCDWVMGPIHHPKERALVRKLKSLLEKLDYVGAISFELFDVDHQLLVNEVAPRVHNSAHYSQDALTQSQFLLHILAGLGEKLRQPSLRDKAFCMVNLLGRSDKEPMVPQNLVGRLHWYGKLENRPGRKMGHLNYLGDSSPELLKKAISERKKFVL